MDLSTVKNKITDITKDIQDRLKIAFPEMTVDLFSKQPAEYWLRHPVGAMMVHFGGSRYSKSLASDIIVQQRILSIQIIISIKNLKSDDTDIQNLVDKTRLVLTGYRPCGSKKMYPVSETYIDEINGIWLYGITFEVENTNIEALEDEEVQEITSVTIDSNYYSNTEVDI